MNRGAVWTVLAMVMAGATALGQGIKKEPDSRLPAPPTVPPKATQPEKPPPKGPLPAERVDVPGVAASYSVAGVYVEACTCRGTCQAEVTGEATGCDAVGAAQISEGKADGRDISGCRVAFAIDHKDRVHVYLDAPGAAERGALEAFARAAFGAMGTIESVKAATISLTGADGAYTVKIDDGKVLTLTTEPVFGGDHKTPVALNNSQHPLNPTLYQGRCVWAKYTDGEHAFEIEKGRNSFFNQHMRAEKKPE